MIYVTQFLESLLTLFLDSAPWLLLGFMIAGLMKHFISMTWMEKQLGGAGAKPVIKAAFLGAPLPLCSCGVIPAAIGLRQSGASKGATTSFLIATPETGVDSISISYVLLGPLMAIIRPIAAITSAIVAGLLVGKEAEIENNKLESLSSSDDTEKSCCPSKEKAEERTSRCCSSKPETKPEKEAEISFFSKVKSSIQFATNDIISDIALWLAIGLSFAALVDAFVPSSFLTQWGNGLFAMLVMVIISIPMYICATASTPIAAGLLLAGVSPGAVLVFMMAGPATNIATLGVVYNQLGRRSVIAYLTGVIGMAMAFGWLVDILVEQFGFMVQPLIGEEHRVLPDAVVYSSGFILTCLLVRLLFKKFMPTSKTASCH